MVMRRGFMRLRNQAFGSELFYCYFCLFFACILYEPLCLQAVITAPIFTGHLSKTRSSRCVTSTLAEAQSHVFVLYGLIPFARSAVELTGLEESSGCFHESRCKAGFVEPRGGVPGGDLGGPGFEVGPEQIAQLLDLELGVALGAEIHEVE